MNETRAARVARSICGVLASLWMLTGCGPVGGPDCANGQTIACACPGGASGTQTCIGGAYGSCSNCSSAACTAGATVSCECPNGGRGTQTCDSSGTFGACEGCPAGCAISGCNAGYQCSSAGVCVINPSAHWTLTATTGSVSVADCTGTFWDIGGYPDPYLQITLNGTALRTPTANDTLTPRWNTTFDVTAAQLLSGVPFASFDEDTVSDEAMCNGTLLATEGDFVSAGLVLRCTCSDGSNPNVYNFTLAPQ